MAMLAKISLGASVIEGHRLLLHPLAFAGWLGLMVTALNLLPIGRLDGGHIARAMFGGRKGHTLSVVALVSLFALALFVWLVGWAVNRGLRTFSGGQFTGTPGKLSPNAKYSNRGCSTSVTNCGDFGENLFSKPAVGRAPTAATNQNKNE